MFKETGGRGEEVVVVEEIEEYYIVLYIVLYFGRICIGSIV